MTSRTHKHTMNSPPCKVSYKQLSHLNKSKTQSDKGAAKLWTTQYLKHDTVKKSAVSEEHQWRPNFSVSLCKLKLKKANIVNEKQTNESDHAYPNRCGEDVEMQTHATYSITNYLQKECLSSLKSLTICKVNLKLENIISLTTRPPRLTQGLHSRRVQSQCRVWCWIPTNTQKWLS